MLLGSFVFPKNFEYGNPCKQVSSLILYHGRIDKIHPLVEFADSVGGGIFRRRSFYSFKHEKYLYRSINAYFCFRLNTCRSRSPFKLLFPDFSVDARYNSVRTLILLSFYPAPTCLTGQNIEEGFPLKTLPSFRLIRRADRDKKTPQTNII